MSPDYFTKRERRTAVVLLKRAKKILGLDSDYVCHAIDDSVQTTNEHAVATMLVEAISDSLEGRGGAGIECWLMDRGLIYTGSLSLIYHRSLSWYYANTERRVTCEVFEDYRLRWIDWMIEGYSK